MLEHEDAWTRFMTDRFSAGDCTACDAERERGEHICSACGSAIAQPRRRWRSSR
jgi:methionyl-tRNA synthetase